MRGLRVLGLLAAAAVLSGCRLTAQHEFRVRPDGRTDVVLVVVADAELVASQARTSSDRRSLAEDMARAGDEAARELREALQGLPVTVTPVRDADEAGARVEGRALDARTVEQVVARTWGWLGGRSRTESQTPARFVVSHTPGLWTTRGRVEYRLPNLGSDIPVTVRVAVHVPGTVTGTDGQREGASAVAWEAYGTGTPGWVEYRAPNVATRVGAGMAAAVVLAGLVLRWRRSRTGRSCPSCGAPNRRRARYCVRCGAALGS